MTDQSQFINLDDKLTPADFIAIFKACIQYQISNTGSCTVSEMTDLLNCTKSTIYRARGSAKNFKIDQHRRWTKKFVDEIGVDIFKSPKGEFFAVDHQKMVSTNTDNHRHFIYYFSAFSGDGTLKFHRAYLFLDLTEESVILEHHPDQERKANHRSRYEGKLENSEDKVFLTLKKVNPATGKPGLQMAFNTINANLDQLYNRSPFLISTYITFHPDSGIAVLELADSKEAVGKKIKTEKIPDHISFMLYNRRFEVNRAHRNLFDLQNVIKNLKNLDDLYPSYQGFVLYDRTRGAAEIVAARFKIFDSFKISYKSPNRNTWITGHITDPRGDILQCRLHYTRGTHHHRSIINLRKAYSRELKNKGVPEGTLAGNYSMIAPDGHKPISGRIILYPITEPGKLSRDFVVPLNDKNELDKLELEYPTLLNFLSGEYDQYCDSPLQHKESRLRRIASAPKRGEKLDPTLRSFAGNYFSLRVSSRHHAVYMRPVIIDGKSGKANRIISFNQGVKTELSGAIWLLDGQKVCLSFDLQEKIYEDNERSPSQILRQTIMTIEKGQDYRGRVLEGVTTRVNKDGLPITFREFFYPVKSNDFEKIEDLILDFRSNDFKSPFLNFPDRVVKKMLAQRKAFIMVGEKSDKRESWLLGT